MNADSDGSVFFSQIFNNLVLSLFVNVVLGAASDALRLIGLS